MMRDDFETFEVDILIAAMREFCTKYPKLRDAEHILNLLLDIGKGRDFLAVITKYPIVCYGYCMLEQEYHLVENDIPTMAKYTYSTSPLDAINNGWIKTNCKKFSQDGTSVWICPKCRTRWGNERRDRIDNIIIGAGNVDKFYKHRNAIIELINLEAKYSDLNHYYDNLPIYRDD